MAVSEQEGVIKYTPHFIQQGLSLDEQRTISRAGLSSWRRQFFLKGLIGQDPMRYGGFGYGNLSMRVSTASTAFVITGTQTSGLPSLDPRHYTAVDGYDLAANTLTAHGQVNASSEALTHAALYAQDLGISAVFHAHSREIWNATERLGIPATDPDVPYGTPEMAQEMERLLDCPGVRELGIISMLGHEDGIITFGITANEAGNTMLDYLASAGPA